MVYSLSAHSALWQVIDKYNCTGGHIIASSDEGAATIEMSPADAASWAAAFEEFNTARKVNGDAIAHLAVENFHEVSPPLLPPPPSSCRQMRDRVADRTFLLQKRVENRIEKAMSHKFRSGYAMVCYGGSGVGEVTYQMALQLSEVQNEILRELIKDLALELEAMPADSDWSAHLDEFAGRVSLTEAERLIDEKVVPLQQQLGIDLSSVVA
jgi:hypothetical protein